VDDQRQGAAWLQHVVHHFGYTGFVRPVKRLAEGNQSVRSRCRPRQVLGHSLDPADVRDAPFLGDPATFSEHGWIGVEADRLLEQMRDSDSEDARPAASVEEPSAPIQIELPGENTGSCADRIGREPWPDSAMGMSSVMPTALARAESTSGRTSR
jgi:hypothetical protein